MVQSVVLEITQLTEVSLRLEIAILGEFQFRLLGLHSFFFSLSFLKGEALEVFSEVPFLALGALHFLICQGERGQSQSRH